MPDIDMPEEAEPYPQPYPFDDEWNDEDEDYWEDLCDHEWIDDGDCWYCPWCGAYEW